MDRQEVVNKVEELKEVCRQAQGISQEFYEEILGDYSVHIRALKSIGDSYPWEQVLEIQEKHDAIGRQLPNVSDEVFEEYIFLNDLMGVLLK